MTSKERYSNIIKWFKVNLPNAKTELNYNNTYELLIAVILSAQCTDKRVNLTTPSFFKNFPTLEILSLSSIEEVYSYIKSITYPNNKAKLLVQMAKKVMKDYNGTIPGTREELMTLPGVGRKTANVMLISAFNKPAMPVDTHVFRVANRLGLTNKAKTPLETEKTLLKNIPKEYLSSAHHWLVLHGRYTCKAINPNCTECGLKKWCKYYDKINFININK